MRVLEEKLNHIEATGEQTLSIIGNNTPIQVTTPIKPTAPIRPLSKASLQLTRVFLPNQTMNPGSPIIMNMYLTNQGSEPAGDVHRFFAVALSHVQDSKRSDIEMHSRFLKAAAEDRKKWKPISQAKGTTLGIHEALWNTVGLPAISQEQYQGILDGTERIYVYSWATWENAKSNLDICMWMQTPPTATITDTAVVWHDCARY